MLEVGDLQGRQRESVIAYVHLGTIRREHVVGEADETEPGGDQSYSKTINQRIINPAYATTSAVSPVTAPESVYATSSAVVAPRALAATSTAVVA